MFFRETIKEDFATEIWLTSKSENLSDLPGSRFYTTLMVGCSSSGTFQPNISFFVFLNGSPGAAPQGTETPRKKIHPLDIRTELHELESPYATVPIDREILFVIRFRSQPCPTRRFSHKQPLSE